MFPKPAKGTQKSRMRKLWAYRRKVHHWCLGADRYLCRHCLGKSATQTHHIDRKGTSPEDYRESPNMIISLCFDCHDDTESGGVISKEELIEDLEVARALRPPLPDWIK